MPFEPLGTDERVSVPQKPEPDMDSAMLMGCTGFVFASIGGYFVSVWPFFVVGDLHTLTGLGTAAALGFVPAALLGFALVHRYRLPGACGAVGGAMATAIFLHLQLKLLEWGFELPDVPDPEYPPAMSWIAPLVWVLAIALIEMGALSLWPEGGKKQTEA